jgi:hypothetical protein
MKAILFLKGLCFITGMEMNDLLQLALVAHGGLDRWKKVKSVKVAASITGAIWYVKGKGDFLNNVVLTAETRNERLTVDFPGQNKRAIFEPERVVIETEDGTIVPTKRRVYAYEGDYQLVKEPLLVAIDMGEITLLQQT